MKQLQKKEKQFKETHNIVAIFKQSKKNNKLTLDLTILFENRTKFQTSLKYL